MHAFYAILVSFYASRMLKQNKFLGVPRAIQGCPKIGTIFVRINFTKCQLIFKIKVISLLESGENL